MFEYVRRKRNRDLVERCYDSHASKLVDSSNSNFRAHVLGSTMQRTLKRSSRPCLLDDAAVC